MKKNLLLIVLILLFINCSSKKEFLKNGEVQTNMYLYYCNDSLNIYAQLYGDFNLNEMINQKLYKSDKYILRKTGFERKKDKLIFHSFTTMEPYYNVIATLKSDIIKDNYTIEITKNSTIYCKKYFGIYNAYEIIYQIKDKYFSLIFYEKNLNKQNQIKNFIDYCNMKEYTSQAIEKKFCGKENIISLSNEIFNEDVKGNYLTYKRLESLRNNYVNTNNEGIYQQMLAAYMSFAQENKKADLEFNYNSNNKSKKKVSKNKTINKNIEIVDLIDTLKTKQIVLFNEAHHRPKNRYLLGKLLKPLYDYGFRYLGLESFYEDESFYKLGFPNLSNGFYIREPTLSNLIREAVKIGYTVFGYDSESKERENEQAKNIFDNTFKKDDAAKVLILGGFSHIDEKDGWMAEKLNLNYNINPYTVNQTSYFNIENSKNNSLEIIQNNENDTNCDLYINNNLEIINNCFESRLSKNVTIDFPIKVKNYYAVLIYNNDEYEKINNPIPIYVKTLENDQKKININLCNGTYRIIIESIQNTLIYEKKITVE